MRRLLESLNIAGDPTASDILTTLRSISSHLESLVLLKRQELAFITGEPVPTAADPPLPAPPPPTADHAELREDPLSFHEGIDREQDAEDLASQPPDSEVFFPKADVVNVDSDVY